MERFALTLPITRTPFQIALMRIALATALAPVIEFKNSMTYPEEGLGIAGIGGYVYRGERQAQLNGSYLFGVWTQHHEKPDGAIFAASVAGEQEPWEYRKLHFRNRADGSLGHYLLSFGQDNSGALLVNDEHGPHGNTGKVYQIN
ncbi:hypothetical protein [Pontibacter pamirensis]|uniref:hypothetical protein n=1 Tax=Pontibacter pamirensis TaxID=2562824 RepID=UPI0013897A64|nr:hypothetical protein [Pontibacter pamirensis]